MSYRLDPYVPLAAGLVEAAVEQLRLAAAGLGDAAVDPRIGVHDARKALKRVRSLLLLGRDVLGARRFGVENAAMRDIGRLLAPFRDADALLEVLDELVEKERLPQGVALGPVRVRLLSRRRNSVTYAVHDLGRSRRVAMDALTQARIRLGQWQAADDCAPLMARAVKRTFARARRRMAEVSAHPTLDGLHEWRKDLKHCWYMSELLAPAWPLLRAPEALALEQLAGWLGEDHDLALLAEFVEQVSVPWPPDVNAPGVLAALGARQQKLRARIFKLAHAVLPKRPRRVTKTLRQLWVCSGVPVRAAETAAPVLVRLTGR